MLTEAQADAIDAHRDERKERAIERRHLEMLETFSSVGRIDGAQLALFEHSSPGSDLALRAWAASHGLPIDYHPVQDWPGCFVTRVTTKGGADITVHTGVCVTPPVPRTVKP